MPKKNRAAIFARYSSNLQNDLSLDAQVTEIEAFCAKEQLDVTHRFLLPETRSALVEGNDQFQDMIRAARRGEFDFLVLHKLDRFTRDRDMATTYKALLRRHGVQIRSVTENLGDSIHDRLIEGILEAFSEFYSLNLSAETKKGQRAAIRAGRWTGGKAPYGYRLNKTSNGTFLQAEPHEAKIIKDVYAQYAKGHGTEEILGYTETMTGKRWRYPTLLNRLKNPTYKGVLEYGKTSLDAKGNRTNNSEDNVTRGSCEALVSETLWEQVQERIGTAHQRNAIRNYDYLLSSGVLVCAHCGRNAIGECRGRDHLPYYRCSGWRDKLCPVKKRVSVRADKLEEAFKENLKEIIPRLNLKKVYDAVASLQLSRQEFAQEEERAILDELKEVTTQKDNLMQFILQGGAQAKVVGKKLEELEKTELALGESLATVRVKMEVQAKEIAERVQDWFLAMVDQLKMSETNSPEWRRAVQKMFKIEWEWEKKQGSIFMLPMFAENPEKTGFEPFGRAKTIRSTQI